MVAIWGNWGNLIMRKTLTLTLDDKLAKFITDQHEMVDPSEYINQLFHEDMKRHGFQQSASTRQALHDDVIKELEMSVDKDIPAAG